MAGIMPKTAIRGNAILNARTDSDRPRAARVVVKIVILTARAAKTGHRSASAENGCSCPCSKMETNKEGDELIWIMKKLDDFGMATPTPGRNWREPDLTSTGTTSTHQPSSQCCPM